MDLELDTGFEVVADVEVVVYGLVVVAGFELDGVGGIFRFLRASTVVKVEVVVTVSVSVSVSYRSGQQPRS